MSTGRGEDVKLESVAAGSFQSQYQFSSASAPAAATTLSPSALEAMPGEGALCSGHSIIVILLISNAIIPLRRR
jgi:hypothetical protein